MKRLFFCFLIFIGFIFSSCSIIKVYDKSVDWKYHRNDLLKKVIYDKGDTLVYYSGGKGDTLLLLHGFGAGGKITWSSNIKSLAKRHYLIVPDLLAFGETSSANSQFDLDAQAAIVSKICEKEKSNKLSVAGISYGGFVALLLANQNVNLIDKLVIIGSPGHIYDPENAFKLAASYNENHPKDIFIPQNYQAVQRLMDLGFYKDKTIPVFLLKRMYASYFTQNRQEQIMAMNAILRSSIPEIEKKLLDGRTTIIWGKQDEVFDVKYGKQLATVLNAKIFVMDEVGHAANIEKAKAFNTILLNILE